MTKTETFGPIKAVLQTQRTIMSTNGWLVEIIGPPSETWAMDCRIMERRLIFAYPVRLVCEDAEECPARAGGDVCHGNCGGLEDQT